MTTRRDFSLSALGAAVLPSLGCELAKPLVRGPDFHRGVNFTAERPDQYGSGRSRDILRGLPEYGVDSVAFVPYGFCRRGSTEIRFGGGRTWERDEDLARLTKVAHDTGFRVMLKPQIWVPRAFPGDIDFDTADDRRVWFAGYEAFLRHYAGLAANTRAEIFCVGVEFSRMIRYEEEWRRLIGIARNLYSGQLVYAANWGKEFETINFWDALDYIGLNNYYPLPDSLATAEVVAGVERVHRRFNRPVLFPEAGFPSLVDPHREPWADKPPRRISLEDQARCYEATFQAFYSRPWFTGVYWWKVGSNGFGGPGDGSHTPWGKPAMDVIARWYRRGQQG